MSKIEAWWRKEGSFELNKALIELVGEHLGYVPIMNLLESYESLSINEKEDLLPIMVEDGCKIRKQVFDDGSSIYSIWVK